MPSASVMLIIHFQLLCNYVGVIHLMENVHFLKESNYKHEMQTYSNLTYAVYLSSIIDVEIFIYFMY